MLIRPDLELNKNKTRCICRFGSRTAVRNVVNNRNNTNNSNNTNSRTEVRRPAAEGVLRVLPAARASRPVQWLSAANHRHPATITTTIQTPVRRPVLHHLPSFPLLTTATPLPVATSNLCSAVLHLSLSTTPATPPSGVPPQLTAAWTEAVTLAWVWV